jgi:hypothetical protein
MAMTTPIEFIVNGFVTGFAGELRIIGRCGDATIRIGDLFDKLQDKIDGARPVRLEVVAIQAYGRNLSELGFGMTGAIDVRGEGIELIRPSSVLVGTTADEPTSRESASTAATVEHV